MRSLKALKELIRNFQFNNAEQTRELQWQQLRVMKELDERLVELERKVVPKPSGSPYDLSRRSQRGRTGADRGDRP